MTLFDGPRDVTDHLNELESRLNPAGYDHQKGELISWRAERQLERIRESEIENLASEPKWELGAWLLGKILLWMRAVLPANMTSSGQRFRH